MQIDVQGLDEAVAAALAGPPGASVGDTVIAWGATTTLTYGGPDRHGSSFTLVIGRGVNSMTVLCPPDRVAPADTPLADAKDPRITVVRLARPTWSGAKWRLDLDIDGGAASGSTHATKRDAVNEGQRRLAIADWRAHHQRPESEVPEPHGNRPRLRLDVISPLRLERDMVVLGVVNTDAPTQPVQPMAAAMTVKDIEPSDEGGRRGLRIVWNGDYSSGWYPMYGHLRFMVLAS